MQQHFETWLGVRRERDADAVPIPRHIERELRGFLECGILARGFARARCGVVTFVQRFGSALNAP